MSYYLIHKIRDIRSLIKFIIDTWLNNRYRKKYRYIYKRSGNEIEIKLHKITNSEISYDSAQSSIYILAIDEAYNIIYRGHKYWP